jgi:hypothetical protein
MSLLPVIRVFGKFPKKTPQGRSAPPIICCARRPAALLKGWTMGEFEIELVLKERSSVIGKANDVESALNLMDEAMRQYPQSHIRLRRGTSIIAERVPPRNPK